MAPITRWRHTDASLRGVLRRKAWITRLVHGTGLYAALERAWGANRDIEVTRHRIAARVERPLTLALASDLHVLAPGPREERLLALLERERPDAIALNGDFGLLGGAPDASGPVLARMRAPLGVWATLGNWDYGHPVPDWRGFLGAHGVTLLTNAWAPLAPGLVLAGLDSALVGMPDLDAALAGVPAGAFVALMVHCPVLFDDVDARVPLVLAGHTHGGQLLLPGLGALYMPRGCGPYRSGWYGREGARMYVSRGIGCSSLPIRVRCAPELALFTFAPE